jgi:octaprenyl-diphosphate synthase
MEDMLRSVSSEIGAALESIDEGVFDFREFPVSFMGKAARARFMLLMSRALAADPARAEKAAAAAELTHTASLLHDDCIDSAALRRGLPSLNARLGVNASILVGDLVIALAFDCAGRADRALQPELVLAVKRMTEGALLEENSRGRRITAEEAERIVSLKTGALFRWCALASCHLAGRHDLLETCARIGSETGSVFQVIDDVLDFEGDPEACGKEVMKDIAEGKSTLPLILALRDPQAGPRAEKLLSALAAGPRDDLAPALELAALVRNGGFSAAARKGAQERLSAACELAGSLPDKDGAAALRGFMLALGERRA